MAERKIYKTENVKLGQKANWPNESDYVEPSKNGYLFNGWDFDWENTSVTETTPEAHEIHPLWDRILKVVAETNHTIISSGGDDRNDPTRMYYYIITESGKIISEDAEFNEVPLNDGEQKISFKNLIGTLDKGKNVRVGLIVSNTTNSTKYYRFKAKTVNGSKYGNMESNIVEIKQVSDSQILIPDFDYFVFTYNWNSTDGTDLDSLTCLDSTIDGCPNPVNLMNDIGIPVFPVGFGALCEGVNTSNFGYIAGVNTRTNTIHHSGDNQQSGKEGAVIDIKAIISAMTYKTVTVEDISSYSIGGYYTDNGKEYEITDIDDSNKTITYKSGYIDNYSKLVFNIYNYWYQEKGNGNAIITFDAYKGGTINIDTTQHTMTPSNDSNKVIDTDSEELSIIAGTRKTGVSMGSNAQTFFGLSYAQRHENSKGWASNFRNADEYDNFIKKCNFFFTKVASLTYDIKSKTAVFDFNTITNGIVSFDKINFFHGIYNDDKVIAFPSNGVAPPTDLLSFKVNGTEITMQNGKEKNSKTNYEHYTEEYVNNISEGIYPTLDKGDYYIIPANCHIEITLADSFENDNSLYYKASDANGNVYTWENLCPTLSQTLTGSSKPYKRTFDYDASKKGSSSSGSDEKGNKTEWSSNGGVLKYEYVDIVTNVNLTDDKKTLSFDVNNQDTESGYFIGAAIYVMADENSTVIMNDNASNSGIEFSADLLNSTGGYNYNTYIKILIDHA